MKKIAFFVEGYTEQFFLYKLLVAIFNRADLSVQLVKMTGGKQGPVQREELNSGLNTEEASYFILIYDCTGETNVKSYILDQKDSLYKSGYSKILGIRDVYPNCSRSDIEKLKRGLLYRVPQKEIPINFILVIMEIEAWFLAEATHFSKISKELTSSFIKENFQFNPENFNTENIDEAANMLNNIYESVGSSYEKSKFSIDRTINCLDMGDLYLAVKDRIPSLEELCNVIDGFIEED